MTTVMPRQGAARGGETSGRYPMVALRVDPAVAKALKALTEGLDLGISDVLRAGIEVVFRSALPTLDPEFRGPVAEGAAVLQAGNRVRRQRVRSSLGLEVSQE
jgi:hypothetical protein